MPITGTHLIPAKPIADSRPAIGKIGGKEVYTFGDIAAAIDAALSSNSGNLIISSIYLQWVLILRVKEIQSVHLHVEEGVYELTFHLHGGGSEEISIEPGPFPGPTVS